MENKGLIRILVIGALTIGLVLISGCIEDREPTTPYLPITTSLSISKPPALGQTAELTVTFSTGFNASNLSISIELPEGLEYVSGDLSWRGDVIEGKPVQFSAVVKAVKTGTWLVMARGIGYNQLYLLISEDSAKVSKNPFPSSNRSKSKKMAVPMNDSEIPSQPPSNFSGVPEEPVSPNEVNP